MIQSASSAHNLRVLLILPRDSIYRHRGAFHRFSSYAPLTLTTLAALIPDELNARVDIVDEGIQSPSYQGEPYDVVGITCVVSSAARSYKLAAHFRGTGSWVVLGGAHATLNPAEAAEHADAVVTGPAEQIWPGLLREVADGKRPSGVHRGETSQHLETVIPRRDLLPRNTYLSAPTVLTARGCGHHCSFCTIPCVWKGQLGARSIPHVIDEISQLRGAEVLFLDPNLTANHERAVALLEALIPLRKRWFGLATLDIAEDRELLDLAVRSGCRGLLFGFETVCQDSLAQCGKPFQQVTRYREAVHRLHAHGIGILGCFIFGFDGDTERVFRDTLEFLDRTRIDIPRFAALTPFPGTPLFKRYKARGQILTEDWSRYDTQTAVIRPEGMSPETLQKGLYEIWKKTYSPSRILKRTAQARGHRARVFAVSLGFRYHAASLARHDRFAPTNANAL